MSDSILSVHQKLSSKLCLHHVATDQTSKRSADSYVEDADIYVVENKDHEREEIKRSTDSKINKLVWKAPSEVETPEKDAGTRNIHPSGKTSARDKDHGTKTHVSCR